MLPSSAPSNCMQICLPNCIAMCARRNWLTILCEKDCKKVCTQSCGMAYLTILPAQTSKITLSPQNQLALLTIQSHHPLDCNLQCPQSCATNCNKGHNVCKLICQQNCSKICGQQILLSTSQSTVHPSSCMQNCPSSCISSCTSRNFSSSLCMQICQPVCTEACIPIQHSTKLVTPSYQLPDLLPITCEKRCHTTCMATCRAQNWSQKLCLDSCQQAYAKACMQPMISIVPHLSVTAPVTLASPRPSVFVVSSNTPIPVIDSHKCLDKCMT